MRPPSLATRPPPTASRLERLESRLRRERLARAELELIAERTTRALYDKQRELVLLEAVVASSNESTTVKAALQGAVDAVCAHTGWPVGHAYLHDPASGNLLPSAIWHLTDPEQFEAFRTATEKRVFARGAGLPGRVLASEKATWVADVTSDPNFPRKNLGVRGAFAFPIIADTRVTAVLEYFTPAAVAPDAALLKVMAQVGRQLGRVVERIRSQEQIAHQAMHDALTGLPNRLLFRDRLELALARNERHGTFAAVLFLDLDRFKIINDTRGHSVGDQLLKQVSLRLSATLRASDTLARFGGDEFMVVCEDLAHADEAVRVADRFQQALLSPFVIGRDEYLVTASIGVTIAGDADRDADSLLRDADIAMYRAKERGAGNWELFDEALRSRVLEHLAIERALPSAIENGELRLHYQPIVWLPGGAIRSAEALVRWEHPERGLISPAEFVPIAEESDLILQIGEWTLREACAQACRWRARFGDHAPLPVSVNLSARQLAQAELPQIVEQVLTETRLSASDLALEITETALIENSNVAATSLRELKALGVTIMLDDFGTGYSSLSHLQMFPIDVLKIDRSFIMHLEAEDSDCAIVRAIAAMASALELEVVAEGVETVGQVAQVLALGCGSAQGYYFARPAPPEQLESLIDAS